MTISFDEALARLAIAYDDEDAPAGPAGQEPTRPVEKIRAAKIGVVVTAALERALIA